MFISVQSTSDLFVDRSINLNSERQNTTYLPNHNTICDRGKYYHYCRSDKQLVIVNISKIDHYSCSCRNYEYVLNVNNKYMTNGRIGI